MRRIILLCAGFCFVTAGSPIEVGWQSPQDATVTASYPDSTSGLEHLVKDILKAQKAGDGVRAQQLIDSLILPDYQNWYSAEFDEETAAAGIASYKAGFSSLSLQLARFFLTVQQNQSNVSAVRFAATCDDNASDHTFGVLLRDFIPCHFMNYDSSKMDIS